MKAIMVMFDSLNRRMLPPYGCEWVHAHNFQRLSNKCVTFDNCYVGSMPCMPARRELHTGRYNFLHRSWGPIEPFDDSMPEILKYNGIYTHLASDHYHYWEDGGLTYHTRYTSWEFARGQEGDPWKGEVEEPEAPEGNLNDGLNRHFKRRQDWVNRKYMQNEEDQPQAKTFKMGLEFIDKNYNEDNWFLHIETFDPHEPYFSHQKYKDLYPHEYNGSFFDWPPYRQVSESADQVEHMRYENAALVSMCDEYMGKIIDKMDELDLWKDTLLIVNTDHGFLLGEHGWWAKCVMPFYDEVAHAPLFIWDPRSGKKDERRDSLVQTIDLPATILEYFNIESPKDMQGVPLKATIENDTPVREAGLFGIHGGHVNVTDGRYVYMRAPAKPDNTPLYQYTLMPTRHGGGRAFINPEELKTAELSKPFEFTKELKTLKLKNTSHYSAFGYGTMLFDLQNDPYQENPIDDPVIEQRMIDLMVKLMKENDAPLEQYERLGL